jgi:hypothetical protein
MATLDTKKAYKNFCKKGFQEAKSKSPDHKWIEFWFDGKLTRIRTKFSHGKKEVDNSLIGLMSKQIKLSKLEFMEFADCKLSEASYIKILKGKELLP